MQIHLSPRHLRLTSAIHGYVAEKIGHLEEVSGDIIAAHVVLLHDGESNPSQAYSVKVHIAVPGPDIYAEDRENELYAAIDKVIHKLEGQLRKRKTRLSSRSKHKARKESERRKNG